MSALAAHRSPAVRLMLLARLAEAWSAERAEKHKRDSRGRFVKGSGASHALDAGDEEALGGMSREQLRREARGRGIALKRGASLDEIKDALWDDHNSTKDEGGQAETSGRATGVPGAEADVVNAYAELVGNTDALSDWVGLAAIREKLQHLTRDEQDAALRKLNRIPGVHIHPLANFKSLTPADRAAAMDIGDEQVHAIRIDPRGREALGLPAAPKSSPVAEPSQQSQPAKVMIPAAILAAAPRALDAEEGRGLSKGATAALERYRSSDFTEINAHLRGQAEGKRPAWVDKTVAEMDQAHADSKLTEAIVVHRGIGNVDKVFGTAAKKNLTGAEWTDDAPQSTTADPDIADRFQRSEGEGKRTDARLIVRVPAGVGAIQLSDGRYEAEMLLERGLRMRVVSDTGPWRRGQKRPRTIEVEVVPV